jgi:hypothetical protein
VSSERFPSFTRRSFPTVFVMEAAENRASHDLAWRNIDAQLHRQLRCHPRLSPSRILLCHLHDEFADVLRKSWPTSLRLPFPEHWKPLRCQPIRVSGLTITKASFQLDGLPFFRLLFRSRTALSAEILFLRKQLGFYQERQVQPRRLTTPPVSLLYFWSRFRLMRVSLLTRVGARAS